MKSGNIFWGLLLIVLGGLIFLRNFDIFFFSWSSILRLWPLIFIFWGIAVLPVKSGIKVLLSVITIAIGFSILATNPQGGYFWHRWDNDVRIDWDDEQEEEHPWSEQQFSETMDSSTEFAVLNMDAAAGEFVLSGVTSELFEFYTEGNVGPYEATTRKAGEDRVVIDFDHKKFRGRHNLHNTVEMRLNRNPLWTMNIDIGAADLEMDLTAYRVEKVDIDGGASAIKLKIGDKHPKTKVNIDAGAAGIKIKVPRESACEVHTSTVLSGRDLDGFNKIDRGLYQTPNFSDSANQVMITIDAAVSGVKVERY